jgi:hypothetical protein
MENNLLWFSIILGCSGLFFLVGWLCRKGPPLESFFQRLLRWENGSMRTDTRVMVHELHRKVEELSAKMQRMDAEMQELLKIIRERAPEEESPGSVDRPAEIFGLAKEGFSADAIARRLNLGRGEIELVLSLAKRPSWVIRDKPGPDF